MRSALVSFCCDKAPWDNFPASDRKHLWSALRQTKDRSTRAGVLELLIREGTPEDPRMLLTMLVSEYLHIHSDEFERKKKIVACVRDAALRDHCERNGDVEARTVLRDEALMSAIHKPYSALIGQSNSFAVMNRLPDRP